MAGINGSVSWQIQPLDYTSSNLAGAFWGYRANYLKSANDPLRYQVIWTRAGVNEGVEPSAANYDAATGNGDVVAVTFKVEATVGDGYWEELGSVKKMRKKGAPGAPAKNAFAKIRQSENRKKRRA